MNRLDEIIYRILRNAARRARKKNPVNGVYDAAREEAAIAGLKGILDFERSEFPEIQLRACKVNRTLKDKRKGSHIEIDFGDENQLNALRAGIRGDVEYEVDDVSRAAHVIGLKSYFSNEGNVEAFLHSQNGSELESRVAAIIAGINGALSFISDFETIEYYRIGIDISLRGTEVEGKIYAKAITKEDTKFHQEGFESLSEFVLTAINRTDCEKTSTFERKYYETLERYARLVRDGDMGESAYCDFIHGSLAALESSLAVLNQRLSEPVEIYYTDWETGRETKKPIDDVDEAERITQYRRNQFFTLKKFRQDLTWRLENPTEHESQQPDLEPDKLTIKDIYEIHGVRAERQNGKLPDPFTSGKKAIYRFIPNENNIEEFRAGLDEYMRENGLEEGEITAAEITIVGDNSYQTGFLGAMRFFAEKLNEAQITSNGGDKNFDQENNLDKRLSLLKEGEIDVQQYTDMIDGVLRALDIYQDKIRRIIFDQEASLSECATPRVSIRFTGKIKYYRGILDLISNVGRDLNDRRDNLLNYESVPGFNSSGRGVLLDMRAKYQQGIFQR